jgi:methionine synthase II (cobalamin-independent)
MNVAQYIYSNQKENKKMSNIKTPYRYDFVGSFLRPQALKDAKADFLAGKISEAEFNKVVDEEITKVVAKQKELGFHVITDGEFRRSFWHLDFMWGFEGVAHENTGGGVDFDGELALLDDTYLVGKIKAKAHPFVEYYKFLKQFEDEDTVAKYTIPAPAQTFQQMIVPVNFESTRKFYANNDELIHDIAVAYQDVIKQFYDAGCRNLQFDDCTWGAIVGAAAKQRYASLGIDIEEVKRQLLEVNNLALENKPADMTITSHICRGNYHSTFFTSGPYDTVADYVFAKENVDALFLEYDDARSGGFAPLAKVSSDKKVVLGLITTKRPQLEDKESIKKRIYEAAKYIPLERLALSPQCGFASCEIGNKLTEEEQWAKLKLVKEIAEEVWQND